MSGRTRWGFLITVMSALFTGFCIHWTIQVLQEPHCPQEDSCTVDYHDGAWHIEEIEP